MSEIPALEVKHLEVRYGDLVGVADVSLAVPEGQVVALLGSNGAGKTTTLNAIAGLVRSSGGSIKFRGEEIAGLPAFAIVPKGLALSPEGWRLFVNQTVEQNLRLGTTPLADKSRVPALLERVFTIFPRLAERRRQSAGTLSGGERQMLALGRALMARPRLLLLDEPSLGLAPLIVREIFRIVVGLRELGVSILLVEQNARAALQTADYGYVLETGEVVLHGAASELLHDPRIAATYLGGGVV
jgi:branched-chain amino acid transport system ATP-binding protein